MLFLCFSVKDRIPLVNNFNQFLSNFGIETWYDRRNIYFGDNRFEGNIENGVQRSDVNYAIVFYSDNFAKGNICIDEFSILMRRYQKHEVHIFPIFLRGVPIKIDDQFKICKELVYKEMQSEENFMDIALHIVAKITNDMLENIPIRTIRQYLKMKPSSSLSYMLLKEYENIDKNNLSMRMGYLFGVFEAIVFNKEIDYMLFKTMHFIFYSNCYYSSINEKRELQIMENIILLLSS